MLNYNRLTLNDRIAIAIQIGLGKSYGMIGILLGKNKSTIQREVSSWGRKKYDAAKAHWYSEKSRSLKREGKTKLRENVNLLGYVSGKLELRWSPEQISHSLKDVFSDDPTMQISHEAIYQYVYIHAKKTLREELIKQLRREKKRRGPSRKGTERRGKMADAISIEERPEEVLGREIPGHWEGDLVVGKDHKSAIGTLVERTTRAIIIVPLVAMDAQTVREGFQLEFSKIPEQMKKTMTYDNGKEMAQHKLFTEHTKIQVYFAHPYSPWERPTNENSNGLIRDYFPKGTDFNEISVERLKEVQHQLNTRPRKTLGWKTPKDVFDKLVFLATG
jgi:IS30 family transposase